MQNLGELLDSLGVEANLDDGDLIASAVVVLSILTPDSNHPRLAIVNSDGMTWIQQAGLLRLAERICSEPPDEDCGE